MTSRAVVTLWLLGLGTGAGVLLARRDGPRALAPVAACGIVALSVLWLIDNGPVEGPVVLNITPAHGITFADLLAVPSLAVAGALLWRRPGRNAHL